MRWRASLFAVAPIAEHGCGASCVPAAEQGPSAADGTAVQTIRCISWLSARVLGRPRVVANAICDAPDAHPVAFSACARAASTDSQRFADKKQVCVCVGGCACGGLAAWLKVRVRSFAADGTAVNEAAHVCKLGFCSASQLMPIRPVRTRWKVPRLVPLDRAQGENHPCVYRQLSRVTQAPSLAARHIRERTRISLGVHRRGRRCHRTVHRQLRCGDVFAVRSECVELRTFGWPW